MFQTRHPLLLCSGFKRLEFSVFSQNRFFLPEHTERVRNFKKLCKLENFQEDEQGGFFACKNFCMVFKLILAN